MISQDTLGRRTAERGNDILRGINTIAPSLEKKQTAQYIFDWRELKLWGIDELKLPAESKIEYKTPSVWDVYKVQIIGAIALIILQAVLIFLLLTNRCRRKVAEKECMQTKQRFQRLFTYSPTAMSIYNTNTRVLIDVNPAWEKLFGYMSWEAVGRSGDELGITIPQSPELQSFRSSMDSIGSCTIELDMKRRDGQIRRILSSGTQVENDEENQGIFSTIDVTDFRHMEAEMAQMDRLNLVGEMAASIGHEVRNPMTAVRGYLQFFQKKSEFVKYSVQLTTMIAEIDRANAIITEFLALAKDKVLTIRRGDLNACIKALYPLLQADAFHRGHDLRLELGEIPDLDFDEKEIRQMILNLVRNGMEAMEQSGVVTIRTHIDNKQIKLAVVDRGSGIQEKIMSKLGTPFVTTKDNGTGLGLAVCYRVADRHGAKIDVSTGPTGTTFSINFTPKIS